jgi:hypothetical protein
MINPGGYFTHNLVYEPTILYWEWFWRPDGFGNTATTWQTYVVLPQEDI